MHKAKLKQNHDRQVCFNTLLLAFCAGYCDTVTYTSGHATFSAHITGNFVLFAFDLLHTAGHLPIPGARMPIHPAGLPAWPRLLSLPVFVASIFTARRLTRRRLILLEAILLIAAGSLATLTQNYSLTMLTVFAMGLQNAFSTLFPTSVLGPTTIMTTNVTQTVLNLSAFLQSKRTDTTAKNALVSNLIPITGFTTGCLLGALLATYTGMPALLLPGILLLLRQIRFESFFP